MVRGRRHFNGKPSLTRAVKSAAWAEVVAAAHDFGVTPQAMAEQDDVWLERTLAWRVVMIRERERAERMRR